MELLSAFFLLIRLFSKMFFILKFAQFHYETYAFIVLLMSLRSYTVVRPTKIATSVHVVLLGSFVTEVERLSFLYLL